MKVAISSFPFSRLPIERVIERAARLGFAAIEISANRPHMLPEDYDRPHRRAILELAKARGVTIAGLTSCNGSAQWHLTHPNPRVREAAVRHVKACIDLATDLEAKVIEVVSGRPVIEGTNSAEAVSWLESELHECAQYAGGAGRVIGLEAEPGNLLHRTSQVGAVVKSIGSPSLGFLADLGHLNVEGENLARSISRMEGRLVHVHIHDNDGSKDQHLLPGEGTIDFRSVFDALGRARYDGYLTLELLQASDEAAITRARKKLERMLATAD